MEETIKLINEILYNDSHVKVDEKILKEALELDVSKFGHLPNEKECKRLVYGDSKKDHTINGEEEYVDVAKCWPNTSRVIEDLAWKMITQFFLKNHSAFLAKKSRPRKKHLCLKSENNL